AVEARNRDVLKEAILKASQDRLGVKKPSNALGIMIDDSDGPVKSIQSEKRPAKPAASKGDEIMEYVLDICMNVVQERGFRDVILHLVLDLLNDIQNPDYFSIAKCVVYLDEHSMASSILKHLVERGDGKSLAIAY